MLMINNFTEFYHRRRISDDNNLISAEKIFDFDKYLCMSTPENQGFMKEFIKTQSFTNFIEAAYRELDISGRFSYPEEPKKNIAKTDITFFQHGIKEILRHSYDSLLQKQWKRISNTLDKFSNPINILLTDCRMQYELALRDIEIESKSPCIKKGGILDHSKIIRMPKFCIRKSINQSPKPPITHHIKTNTINVPKSIFSDC